MYHSHIYPKDTGSLKTKIKAARNSPGKMNNEKHQQNESKFTGKPLTLLTVDWYIGLCHFEYFGVQRES